MLRRERVGTQLKPIETYGNTHGQTQLDLSIVYPNPYRITDAEYEWITQDFEQFERALYGPDFTDPTRGYAAYIDVQSFVDYYLLNEFAMVTDAGYLSTYLYKNIGGKITMTVWDFNNGFNNYPWEEYAPDDIIAANQWWERLLEDPAFVEKLKARWQELRAGILSDDAIVNYLDSESQTLGDAIDRNAQRWSYTFYESLLNSRDDGSSRDPQNPAEALQQLKDTALARANWMDGYIATIEGQQ